MEHHEKEDTNDYNPHANIHQVSSEHTTSQTESWPFLATFSDFFAGYGIDDDSELPFVGSDIDDDSEPPCGDVREEGLWFHPRARHELAMQALIMFVRSQPHWVKTWTHKEIRKLGKTKYELSTKQATFCADELRIYHASIEKSVQQRGLQPIPLIADGGAWLSDTAFDEGLQMRLRASFDLLEEAATIGKHRIVPHEPSNKDAGFDLVFSARYGFRYPIPRALRILRGGYDTSSRVAWERQPLDCSANEAEDTARLLVESPQRALECIGRCRPASPTPEEAVIESERYRAECERRESHWQKYKKAGSIYMPSISDDKSRLFPQFKHRGRPHHHAWMPCEVQVNDVGDAVKIMSYVPGLHPKRFASVYSVLEEALAKFIPLWERVLTDLASPREARLPIDFLQVQDNYDVLRVKPHELSQKALGMIQRQAQQEHDEFRNKYYLNGQYVYRPPTPPQHPEPIKRKFDWRDEFGTLAKANCDYSGSKQHRLHDMHGEERIFLRDPQSTHLRVVPNPTGSRQEWIARMHLDAQKHLVESMTPKKVTLAGGRLQVVIRMASSGWVTKQKVNKSDSVDETDDGEEECGDIPSGPWHVDGMPHEHIVASGAVTVDLDGVTAPSIELRHTCAQFETYVSNRNDDDAGDLFDVHPFVYGGRTRFIGKIQTQVGRALAMANIWTHRVTSCHLKDQSGEGRGRRRVLVFFLIDPWRPVYHSTGFVPPQDREWAHDYFQAEMLRSTTLHGDLINLVWGYIENDYGLSADSASSNENEMRETRRSRIDAMNWSTIEAPDMSC